MKPENFFVFTFSKDLNGKNFILAVIFNVKNK